MPTIVIADDDEDLLDDFRLLCSYTEVEKTPLEVVGLCKNGFEAIEALQAKLPDFALLDIEMPGIDGVQVAKKARHISPNTKSIICSCYTHRYNFDELASAGIQGYLVKPFNLELFPHILQTIFDGGTWFDSLMVNKTYQKILSEKKPIQKQEIVLSPFELRLLHLVEEGHDQSSISEILNMNKNTIKTHLTKLRKASKCKDLKALRLIAHTLTCN